MTTILHPHTRTLLEPLLRVSSASYVFHGRRGMGKATAALDLARRLNCQGDANGLCPNCRRLLAGANPDIIALAPTDKPSITIEQVRGVTHTLALSTHQATGHRVVIIDEAQALTLEAQNALLKLIEEPPARTIFVLVTDQFESLLSTIRSRCAAVYFAPVPVAGIAKFLTDNHGITSSDATVMAQTANGAPGTAIALALDPARGAAHLELAGQAQSAPGLSLFARLLLAKRLIDSKADLATFGRLLHSLYTSKLRDGTATLTAVSPRLEALDRFRLQLHAKVSSRVALENLMLDL